MAETADQMDHAEATVVAWPADAADQLAAARHARAAPAVNAALAAADRALHAGPFSVVDDDHVPPSGDKRDYTSLGPYWWPNPTKPDGLPYVRRDGERNPDIHGRDLDAMAATADAVVDLAVGYRLTGRDAYTRHAARLLDAFFLDPDTGMNPHLRYAQRIPGVCDGRGIGLIDTHRLVSMVGAVGLLEGSPSWDADRLAALQAWFRRYLDWFLHSDHGRAEAAEHNNHGTWHDAQAVAYALFVGDEATARDILARVPERRIDRHIEPDGSQPHELARTLSFTYSCYNLAALVALAGFGERVGLDLWRYEGPGGRGIRKAVEFLGGFAERPEAWRWPQIKPRRWSKLASILRQASLALDARQYERWIDLMPTDEVEPMLFQIVFPPRPAR